MKARRLPLLLLPVWLGLSCLSLAPARAEEVAEPASGRKFQSSITYAGKPYSLVGTALRKKFVVKVYAIGLYVDDAAARQAFPSLVTKAGGKEREKLLEGDRSHTFVAWGRFGKLAVMQFLRDVDKGKIQEAYRDSLEGALSDKAPSELSRDANAFVALFDKDVREGQELRIATDEAGKITVEIAGQKKEGPQNPQLARAIWEIWLGQKSILGGGRKGLVDRIDTLGR